MFVLLLLSVRSCSLFAFCSLSYAVRDLRTSLRGAAYGHALLRSVERAVGPPVRGSHSAQRPDSRACHLRPNGRACYPRTDGRDRHFKNATIRQFERAGHWVHHDRLETFMELVTPFIAGEPIPKVLEGVA